MRRILFFILVVGLWHNHNLKAQSAMVIHQANGEQLTIPLNTIQKLTFQVDRDQVTKLSIKNHKVIQTLQLLQNYPNPFNPETTIQYAIPQPGKVVLRIFDINGRLLVKQTLAHNEAGIFTFHWNGQNQQGKPVASGMYFYQIQYGNKVLTKKMILIR